MHLYTANTYKSQQKTGGVMYYFICNQWSTSSANVIVVPYKARATVTILSQVIIERMG